MPAFLDWWENQHGNAIAFLLVDSFVEGMSQPYLTLISQGNIPPWIETMLRWRLAAQWAYQVGAPLMEAVVGGLPALLPVMDLEGFPAAYRFTPADLAEVPPQIRQGFLEGAKFSLNWVTRLSSDAKTQMRQLMAANTLKNRNPAAVVPLLEQILRRDLAAEELGVSPASITAEQLQEWLDSAEFSVLEGIAKRANLIAPTESMRMTNMGILTAMEANGDGLCYVMPHRGTCPECQRLLDGRVFRIQTLKENLFANFGVKKSGWVAAMPQHPKCRHSPMEVPFQFRRALQVYGDIPAEGVLLEWYGLPGKRTAFESLGLERKEWLTREGVMA